MRRIMIGLLASLFAPLIASCGAIDGITGGGGGGGGLPANAVEVTIAYGSEKQVWMEDVVKRYNDAANKLPSGQQIVITATPMGSADSLNRILSGELKPTVWSPASKILIPVANDAWGKANNGAKLVEDNAPQLVLSPVVIGMWEPMARALGWPDKPIGWGDIAELAASGKTWADYGRPEWGPFQFGHTHPDYSNSGIASILAVAYAGTNKTRGLTAADVNADATKQFMADVEGSVIHYGESTGFFGTQMFTRGPSYLSAAVLYENLIIQSRDKTRYPNLSLPIVAIYPKEGTFWTDNPYGILNAPWVSAEQREAATAFQNYLLATPQQQLALQYGFRPADLNVPLGAPIIAENGVDPQQPRTLLEVPSADVIAAVRGIWGENKKRVDVMAVLDISGSMEDEQRLEQAKGALKTFIGQLSDEDGFGLTIFSNTATVLTEISPIGPKRQDILDRIGGLTAGGGTRLLDTVQEAYQTVGALEAGRRIRAVVVLTDGLDNKSTASGDQITALLGQNEEGTSIKVFTIAFGGDADVDLLKRIATASGAKAYAPKPGENGAIEQVYREIATFF